MDEEDEKEESEEKTDLPPEITPMEVGQVPELEDMPDPFDEVKHQPEGRLIMVKPADSDVESISTQE